MTLLEKRRFGDMALRPVTVPPRPEISSSEIQTVRVDCQGGCGAWVGLLPDKRVQWTCRKCRQEKVG